MLLEKIKAKKAKMAELIKSSKLDAVKKLDDSALSMSAGGLIMFAISLIVLAAVVPDAISQFYATNTSAWQINGAEDTKATVLWWLLPFIAVAVVIVAVYKWADWYVQPSHFFIFYNIFHPPIFKNLKKRLKND